MPRASLDRYDSPMDAAAGAVLSSGTMAWEPTEEAWQYRLLDQLPPGLDLAQLERSMRMTPTERLEAVRRMAEFAQDLRRARDRLPTAP
jgi:hypothetical protein